MMQSIKILLSFCFSMACFSAYAQKQYASLEVQAEAISNYYTKTMHSEGKERLEYEQLFFEAFPASLQTFKTMVSYDHCKLFYNLQCSDKAAYYDKYISIALEAIQKHDTSGSADYLKMCLYRKLFYNTKAVLSVLAKRSETDIANFFVLYWRFLH